MQFPEVTIVIPTYNSAELLRQALASVRAQTVTNWEAIVVNNHSVDHTAKVIEEFADARIQLVNFSNDGVIAASRNQGIRLARSPWVAFLDSDDTWAPDKLDLCLSVARKDTSDLIVHDVYLDFQGKGQKRKRCEGRLSHGYKRLLFAKNDFVTSSVMVRIDLLRTVGGFSEDASIVTVEDFDLWLRLAKDGARVTHISEPLGTILISDASASRAVGRHIAAYLVLLDRHYAKLVRPTLMDNLCLRKVRALAWYGGGRVYQRRGDRAMAGKYFRISFTLNPLSPRLIGALLLLLVPFKMATGPQLTEAGGN